MGVIGGIRKLHHFFSNSQVPGFPLGIIVIFYDCFFMFLDIFV